jgi:hypothetical protein
MTKDHELRELDATIKRFGPDSYIGAWLAEYRMAIIDAIASDFPVGTRVPMPGEAAREARELLERARATAARELEAARLEAARELERAREQVRVIRGEHAATLRRLLERL